MKSKMQEQLNRKALINTGQCITCAFVHFSQACVPILMYPKNWIWLKNCQIRNTSLQLHMDRIKGSW